MKISVTRHHRRMFLLCYGMSGRTKLTILIAILGVVSLIVHLSRNAPDNDVEGDHYWEHNNDFQHISQVIVEPNQPVVAKFNIYELIIVINTAVENNLYRTAARSTWSKRVGEWNIRTFFVCTVPDTAASDLHNLTLEAKSSQDIIILLKPPRTTRVSNSSNSLAALEWVHKKFPYYEAVMMTDDHTLVHIDNLMAQLQRQSMRTMYGVGRDRQIVLKDDGFGQEERKRVSSSAYVVGADLIPTLLQELEPENEKNTPEDAAVRKLLEKKEVKITLLEGLFNTVQEYCALEPKPNWSVISSLEPYIMVRLSKQLSMPGGSCTV